MELNWIEQIIEALESVDIPAQRGYPSGLMPSLTEPVATVSIQKAESNAMTAAVQIYSPVSQGGIACENLALQAAEALRTIGATCVVGSCSFSGKGGLFGLPLQVTFTKEQAVVPSTVTQPKVDIDGIVVANVVDVATAFTSTAVKSKDTATGEIGMVAGEKRWTVTIEDLVAPSRSPQEEVKDGFTVTITRSGGKETYSGCCWDKITTEVTEKGTRRIRVAITCNEPVVA